MTLFGVGISSQPRTPRFQHKRFSATQRPSIDGSRKHDKIVAEVMRLTREHQSAAIVATRPEWHRNPGEFARHCVPSKRS